MTFLDAVVAISKRHDLELCDDDDERVGLRNCICVYQTIDGVTEFVGKLRWPDKERAKWGIAPEAHVDEELEAVLRDPTLDGRVWARLRAQQEPE